MVKRRRKQSFRPDHRKFPFYLKQRANPDAQKWLGERLASERAANEKRGKIEIAEVATAANTSPETVEQLEAGVFHLTLGAFYDIVRLGYGAEPLKLFEDLYNAFPLIYNPTKKRRFARDFHYSLSRRVENKRKVIAPLFVGGDPENYLWGVAMRRLKNQSVVTEFLELALMIKRSRKGFLPRQAHGGAEVLVVIFGTVTVQFGEAADDDDAESRTLAQGDCIHFVSSRHHYIENDEANSTALLLVVRVPLLEVLSGTRGNLRPAETL